MTSAMEGGGRYNRNASAQAASAVFGLHHLAAAAATAPRGPGGTVTVVDYGASQGRNSLRPVATAVDALRGRYGVSQQVWVFHADLADNDWTALFRTVDEDPASYRRPGVFSAAVGRSHFERLMPDATVGLGWSSIALHWLSTVPGPLQGFWPAGGDADQQAVWSRAAAEDWARFLRLRSAEMLPGARLVVVVGAARGDGPTRGAGAERAMTELATGLRRLVRSGLLTQDEVDAMVVPAWYRTADEWRAPFADSPLVLESLDLVDLGDPIWEQTQDTAGARLGDYGATVAAALRVSFGPALLRAVDPARRAAVATALFDDHLARAVAGQPPEPWFAWRLAVLVVSRPA
ncbi:hypothetical protein [Nakamurella endophytica]|uniref:SAM-dependent methyltransferase n=1 Tax=Nakamurella endophytica TaxID=1748367 RepID=A0A917SPG5_9ACTN|nr:hypothetical protein [Nakamurella endophytica]GGL92397.1 hypothetical protein GCM10011594_10190 [Nakamurella endophytica]